MKYYYYRVINPNELYNNEDKLTYYNEEIYQTYIGKCVDIEDDDFYNPHRLFIFYKDSVKSEGIYFVKVTKTADSEAGKESVDFNITKI